MGTVFLVSWKAHLYIPTQYRVFPLSPPGLTALFLQKPGEEEKKKQRRLLSESYKLTVASAQADKKRESISRWDS